jgi:Uma2 family endonuclease
VQNAARIIGKTDLDLSQDPPPDIVVEVGRASSSLNRFNIYARLGAPEIWRLRGETVKFHLLENDAYAESTHSRAFPFLASDALSRFLAQSLKEGERLAAKAFRAWVREHLPR